MKGMNNMQDKNKKALDILSDQIIYAVKTICSTLEFDKSYTGIISSVNSDGYTVKYNGTEINIKTAATNIFKKNDTIKFCVPCGNKQKAYIVTNLDLINKINTSGGINNTTLTSHINNKSNPHEVTASQVGLGNVPNVSTNNQTPTYTVYSTLTGLVSGEKLSEAFGKIAKAIKDLSSHLSNKSNPHGVTASQIGALTSSDVVDNLVSTSTNLPLSAKQGNVLNESKAPTNHASENTTYGKATNTNYGHVKLSGSVSNTSGKDDGVAATPSAVREAYNRAGTAITNAKAINTRLTGIATITNNDAISFSLASSTSSTIKDIFTAPANGIYFLDVCVKFDANASGYRYASLKSVDIGGITMPAVSNAKTSIKLSTTVYMSANQVLQVELMQNSGSGLTTTINSRYSYLAL